MWVLLVEERKSQVKEKCRVVKKNLLWTVMLSLSFSGDVIPVCMEVLFQWVIFGLGSYSRKKRLKLPFFYFSYSPSCLESLVVSVHDSLYHRTSEVESISGDHVVQFGDRLVQSFSSWKLSLEQVSLDSTWSGCSGECPFGFWVSAWM